jgi:hypothetical protein
MPVAVPSRASSNTCTPAPTVVSCCNSLASYVWFRATAHPPAGVVEISEISEICEISEISEIVE